MGRGTRYAEREVKMSAGLEFELPDLRKLGLGTVHLPLQRLRTSYFDTQDLRLWQRGITLRHRVGEDDSGTWTLKLPEESRDQALSRTEVSWPGEVRQVPSEATGILQGIVRRATLEPVVILEAIRQRLVVQSGEASLGEIDDDIVTVASGGKTGLTFRQIEFELSSDHAVPDVNQATIELVLKAMQQAGAQVDPRQKFAMSLGGEDRPEASAHKMGRRSTLASVVQQSLCGGLGRILDFDVVLRSGPANPSARAIHQTRVATRRLRSDLKTFRPVLDPIWLEHTRSDLKWLGAVLGRVRDVDVLAERLASHGATSPLEDRGEHLLLSKLAGERRRHSKDLQDALQSERYLDMLDRLHAGVWSPPYWVSPQRQQSDTDGFGPDAPARDVLPQLVDVHWRKLRRRVRRAGPRPTDAQLHRIRIASKEVRYAAEAAAAAIGTPARRMAHRAEDLQTVLGQHHDSVAAVGWLERVPAPGAETASFAAGIKVAEERHRQAKLRRRWGRSWRRLDAGKVAHWLERP